MKSNISVENTCRNVLTNISVNKTPVMMIATAFPSAPDATHPTPITTRRPAAFPPFPQDRTHNWQNLTGHQDGRSRPPEPDTAQSPRPPLQSPNLAVPCDHLHQPLCLVSVPPPPRWDAAYSTILRATHAGRLRRGIGRDNCRFSRDSAGGARDKDLWQRKLRNHAAPRPGDRLRTTSAQPDPPAARAALPPPKGRKNDQNCQP